MTEYHFIAKDSGGNTVKSSLVAPSRYQAVSDLKKRGLTVISIDASSARPEVVPDAQPEKPLSKSRIFAMETSKTAVIRHNAKSFTAYIPRPATGNMPHNPPGKPNGSITFARIVKNIICFI